MTRFSSRKFEVLTLQEAPSPRSHVVPLNVELQLNTGMDRQGCLMQMPSWKISFYEMPWLIFERELARKVLVMYMIITNTYLSI